ncbi:unnamed protein product [Didymodactylos carnosus]|uniref:Uncharacterized protein n=1 Tax=Didymodactylos carnosus TaxID=1234261 RepID=A0A814L8W3_9BILA|nr:unnamed protein product [Didymodactylos carnosus]CAF3830031.1 unnamed protein product [Didymodactylos carnosus]
MSTTFETLPNEILMIIFRYAGDVHTILRTFLGLNQRLNRILIDKRLHLLTDILSINSRHVSFDNYYNSAVFHKVSHELSVVNGTVNEQQLHQCFQSLMSFHVQQLYKQSGDELQSNLTTFKVLRQQLTNDEIIDVDKELYQTFTNLQYTPMNIDGMKQIEFLVLKRGARLECSDSEQSAFNLAMAINRLLHFDLSNMNSNNQQLFHLKTQMFKAVISSNPRLLSNQDYFIYSVCTVWYFLFYGVCCAQYYGYHSYVMPVNMKCYQAVVNLAFFAIQCQRLQCNIEDWTQTSLFDILYLIPARDIVNRNEIFIANAQWKILQIITDIYISTGTPSWQVDANDRFQSILIKLINKNRTDVILFIYHRLEHVRHFFNQSRNCRSIIDSMTRNHLGRQLLKTLMNESPLETWVTSKDLVFILLQKKERKLLEHLLRLSLSLVHHLDEDGNDLLLHVCLKVRGCRHRLVEFLIKINSDLQRRNFNGQNFLDVIKLRRNRELLEKLNVEEFVNIDEEQTKPHDSKSI